MWQCTRPLPSTVGHGSVCSFRTAQSQVNFSIPVSWITNESPISIVDTGTAYDGLYTVGNTGSGHGYELLHRPFQVRTLFIGVVYYDCFAHDNRHYERIQTQHIAKMVHLIHGIHAPEIPADIKLDLGIFTPSGLCVNEFAVSCPYLRTLNRFYDDLFSLWGDDPATDEVDGMLPGDELSFRLWRADTGDEYILQPVYSDNSYGNPGVVYVDSLIVEKKVAVAEPSPAAFTLAQNVPNPFNPTTSISYTLPEAAKVTLTIYSALGTTVGTIVDEWQPAGSHTVEWDGSVQASGVYFYRLDAEGYIDTKRMVLVK